jgi:hypothetical protein
VPDQHYEDALERVDALLKRIEGVEVPVFSESEGVTELLQDALATIAEKAIILRDRMNNDEASYTVGGG